jgi:hypothetical protein
MKYKITFIIVSIIFLSCSDFTGNEDAVSNSLSPDPCDNTTPILSEINPIGSTQDTTPDWTFSCNRSGKITYSGACTSSVTNAVSGNNLITFNELSLGDYYYCGIKVSSYCQNPSTDEQDVSDFTIFYCDPSDNTTPTINEVTRVGLNTDNKTNDNTPAYTFYSNESGTITYGGSCSSTSIKATAGNNTITFNNLNEGTYSDCTLRLEDCNGNLSNNLSISQFEIYNPQTLRSITYGNGIFVAVGHSGRIVSSPSGDNGTWITRNSNSPRHLYSVGTDNTNFIAAGQTGTVLRSGDSGVTWEEKTWDLRQNIEGIAYGDSKFVCV